MFAVGSLLSTTGLWSMILLAFLVSVRLVLSRLLRKPGEGRRRWIRPAMDHPVASSDSPTLPNWAKRDETEDSSGSSTSAPKLVRQRTWVKEEKKPSFESESPLGTAISGVSTEQLEDMLKKFEQVVNNNPWAIARQRMQERIMEMEFDSVLSPEWMDQSHAQHDGQDMPFLGGEESDDEPTCCVCGSGEGLLPACPGPMQNRMHTRVSGVLNRTQDAWQTPNGGEEETWGTEAVSEWSNISWRTPTNGHGLQGIPRDELRFSGRRKVFSPLNLKSSGGNQVNTTRTSRLREALARSRKQILVNC